MKPWWDSLGFIKIEFAVGEGNGYKVYKPFGSKLPDSQVFLIGGLILW